jgi:ABC-type nickel/cobalt efflux system permease component RcnA
MMSLLTTWSLAFVLGLRHATEPDHVAAVATLVPEQRNARRAMQLGAAWGLGHCLAILACGGALLLLRKNMSERVSDCLELTVACLLVALGVRSIRRALTKPALQAEHDHSGHTHAATGSSRRKSLAIGLLHGVAGSGSMTALVFASMPDLGAGFAYLVFFGVGSIFGMALLTGVAGTPLSLITKQAKAHAILFAAAGLLSLSIGVSYGYPIAQRLFGA